MPAGGKHRRTNEKYTFRTWLLRLGLNGDEFKTARLHLLKHLDGCIAWKDPAQAEAQKERLRMKREKELQMQEGRVPAIESETREQEKPCMWKRGTVPGLFYDDRNVKEKQGWQEGQEKKQYKTGCILRMAAI